MNTGPGLNSNSDVRWLKIEPPVTSEGIRSGVNWTRENRVPVTVANDRAVSVFASRDSPRSGRARPPERAERQVEGGALADHRALHLIQDPVSSVGELRQPDALGGTRHVASPLPGPASPGAC